MKRLVVLSALWCLLTLVPSAAFAHGGWAFSWHYAPPPPPPCYHYHYAPPCYYPPAHVHYHGHGHWHRPRVGLWFGF